MWQRDFGGAVCAALLLAACGGAAAPTQKLSNARAAVRGAEEVGAERNPKAALHLKMARDQLARAQRQIENGDNEEAALTLNQAQADADLALGLTYEHRERLEAEQAKARIRELRSQNQVQ